MPLCGSILASIQMRIPYTKPSLYSLQTESVASIPSLHRAVPVRFPSYGSTSPSNASDPSQCSSVHHKKPIITRVHALCMASRNKDNGEGIDVTELDDDVEIASKARLYARMLPTAEVSTASSAWDETVDIGRGINF